MSESSKAVSSPIHLGDNDFNKALTQHPLIIVDFWAEWCGPCRMVAPVIEELAKEFHGNVVFGKLNVDENRQTATRFSIMSIPTLMIFKNGEAVDKIIGAVPKTTIKEKIEKYL